MATQTDAPVRIAPKRQLHETSNGNRVYLVIGVLRPEY